MGIWDYINSATATISDGVARSGEIAGGAAVWTGRVVEDRIPDREGWKKIGWLGLRIADHAIDRVTKPFTYGIPVYKFLKEEIRKDYPQERSVKDEKENMEFAILKARIESLEKENKDLQGLKLRLGGLEEKLMKIKQSGPNQKAEKRAVLMYWSPAEPIPIDLSYNQEFTPNFELSL